MKYVTHCYSGFVILLSVHELKDVLKGQRSHSDQHIGDLWPFKTTFTIKYGYQNNKYGMKIHAVIH